MNVPAIIVIVFVAVSAATAAAASPVTLVFSGTADLSVLGAPAASTITGSLTWDTATAPTAIGSIYAPGDTAWYETFTATFAVNGVDFSSEIQFPFLRLTDGTSPSQPDLFFLYLPFSTNLDLGAGFDIQVFMATFSGDALFSSIALPGDLTFLPLTSTFPTALSLNRAPDPLLLVAVVASSPVPEPASMILVGTGILAAALRRQRHLSKNRIA